MRKLLLAFFGVVMTMGLSAQSQIEVFKKNINYSASNYLAYPGPTQGKLTKAPAGKKPFYLSHYGRHGSRYHNNRIEYDYPYDVLTEAERWDKLSPLGKDVLRRVTLLRQESWSRLGDLTPLGAQQHKDIARRMVERFPEVFEGEAVVDAKSTIVVRCILSMENALHQLLKLNPKLKISHDASYADMYYMNQQDPKMVEQRMTKAARDAFEAYCKNHEKWHRMVNSLFNDTAYVSQNVNGERLNYYLFNLASNVQSTELRDQLTLYDIFNDEEILCNWQRENTNWFLAYGNYPVNGGQQPFIQRNLLRQIIELTDSCIQLERPGVTLRYGHETIVMPLTCLIGLNGYDQPIDDLNQLEQKGWLNYRVFPMACNIQFVFYRSSPQDKDILFKVLLNENEATLPLKSKTAPYYRWADFREYCLKKLASFKEE